MQKLVSGTILSRRFGMTASEKFLMVLLGSFSAQTTQVPKPAMVCSSLITNGSGRVRTLSTAFLKPSLSTSLLSLSTSNEFSLGIGGPNVASARFESGS